MITQFPSFYPDELIYSFLARYYERSGYIRYIFAAEDLFQSKTVRPDIEFLNLYTPAALQMITKEMNMEQVVEKHTMFSYYGRFLPLERKQRAFQSLVNMQGNYYNLLPMPKRKDTENRYLRYCPMCAAEDRKQYGETYWHRIHQMQGVNICPLHCCRLVNSELMISGKTSPVLITSEEVVPKEEIAVCSDNKVEIQLAEYVMNVFLSDMDMKTDIATGAFLHSRLFDTKYVSIRGEQRNIALIHKDFSEYYKLLPDNYFTELWQIQKIFTNDKYNPMEVCMIAMFFNVPVSDLVRMKLPEKSQMQLFDEQVHILQKQGLKYPEIAKQLNASVNVVKPVGNGKYGYYHYCKDNPLKGGIQSKDWKSVDKDTLPLVKQAIRQLKGNGKDRPKKVTVFAVEQMLNLPSKRISLYLPMCRAEIEKYRETQEQYWAREIIWAVNVVCLNGQPLNWKHIRDLTNTKKRDVVRCLPEIQQIADNETVELVRNLL